jgi:hypothetical protein
MTDQICPPECKLEQAHMQKAIDDLKTKDEKIVYDLGKRIRTATVTTSAVVVIGILSGLLGILYFQSVTIDKKVDMLSQIIDVKIDKLGETLQSKVDKIREYQVRVLTVLELKGLLKAAEVREANGKKSEEKRRSK